MKSATIEEYIDEDVEELANNINCEVVYPEPNQLQIDVDSENACAYFWKRLTEIKKDLGWVCKVETWSSKSGPPNRHFVVTVKDRQFPIWERIALQTMLGSDPVREGMIAMRHLRGAKFPCRLFKPLDDTKGEWDDGL